ncbi:CUB and sushi domain-containing protein 3-like isoform X2 [Ornithodoros turicata]|uniref:CUB and sushi domain-containing protein 3-like isoform X2 n=1 Tax=Ornithodoros turicata TaxID=34597 RepID=UPI003138FD20
MVVRQYFSWSEMAAVQLALLCWLSFLRLTLTQSCSLDDLTTDTTLPYYDVITATRPYGEGEVAPYTCQPGYRQTSPPPRYRNATCRSGIWEYPSNTLICAPVNCGHPGTVKHGFLEGSVFTFPNSVKYRCDDGYFARRGTETLFCQSDGKWSPEELPTCEVVNCGHPGEARNCILVGNDFTFRRSVTYQSEKGYIIHGTATLICNGDGKWHPEELPTCEVVSCGDPGTVAHGSREGNNFTFPNSVNYQCEKGYTLNGADTLVCQISGRWSPRTPPRCEIVNCGHPGEARNCILVGNDFTFRRSVTYQSEKGYIIHGTATLICNGDGKWHPEELPTCEVVSCGDPGTVAHGSREGNNFTFPNSVNYQCEKGYTLNGADTLVCQISGRWSPRTPPRCETLASGTANTSSAVTPQSKDRNVCRPLEDPHNGMLVSNGTTSSLATFACKEGYVMQGPSTLVCQPGGTWDPPQPPACEAPFPWAVVVGVVAAILGIGVAAVYLFCRRRLVSHRSEIRKPSASDAHTQSEVAHLHKPCLTTSL